jgi:hypothetical protein
MIVYLTSDSSPAHRLTMFLCFIPLVGSFGRLKISEFLMAFVMVVLTPP